MILFITKCVSVFDVSCVYCSVRKITHCQKIASDRTTKDVFFSMYLRCGKIEIFALFCLCFWQCSIRIISVHWLNYARRSSSLNPCCFVICVGCNTINPMSNRSTQQIIKSITECLLWLLFIFNLLSFVLLNEFQVKIYLWIRAAIIA